MTLAACADTGKPTISAPIIPPQDFGAKPELSTAPVSGTWWRELGDEQLARLVDRALEAAPSLKLAQARLARAQALAEAAQASLEPSLSAGLDLNRQRFSENGLVPAALAGQTKNLGNLQAAGTWEFDFFGRHRSELEAALGTERAVLADSRAARGLLANQVSRTYVQLGRLIEQRTILRTVLARREQAVRLLEERLRAGLDDAGPRQQAQAAVAQTRLQLAAIEDPIGLARNMLAALSAQPPAATAELVPGLPLTGGLPLPADVPADLIGRRADLVAARWRVESALQDVASARAQFYPNVNLAALVGLNSIGLDRLLRPGSLQLSVGPAIRLPLFDGGRLRANLRVHQAELDAAIESYNQALLDAVRDVADQLASLRAIAGQQQEQLQAARVAAARHEHADRRFRAGLGTRLAVLEAEDGVLAQQLQTADLRARQVDTHLALLRALGGGYAADAR